MRRWLFFVLPLLGVALLVACGSRSRVENADASASTTAAEIDAASELAVSDAGTSAPRLLMKLAAANFVASVSDQPDWPENDAGARRLGYLRNGAIVEAYDPPVVNDECKEGWYELKTGGYVCGKHATIDLTNPRVRLAPKQPDRDAGMPYRYGINVADGTPLYRRVLSAEDRARYEHPAKPKPAASTDPDAPPASDDDAKTTDAPEPAEMAVKTDTTEPKDDEPPLAQEDEPPPPRRHTREKHDKRSKSDKHAKADKKDKPVKDPFKDRAKGDRPSLSELKGRGVLVRKLARGFTIAVDRDFKGAGTRWWRTTFGFAVPYDKIVLQQSQTKYVGNWFTGKDATTDLLPLPYVGSPGFDAGTFFMPELDAGAGPESLAGAVGFVTSSGASRVEIGEDAKGNPKIGYGAQPMPRRSAVLLTGRTKTVSGMTFYETSGGTYVALSQLRLAHPQIPSDVGENEKWIDVDLTRQQLVAFEGTRPVFATLISSGRKNPDDPEHNYATPPGSYRIREKHVTATMDADTASDGPYSIEDVPWVMYFQGSYALHGAFWHDGFGAQRSHGCVNMSPEDARTLFAWSDPPLPDGWHGVFSKDDNTGSRVIVHEDPPKKR